MLEHYVSTVLEYRYELQLTSGQVLGGQKISGADIRDQNGTFEEHPQMIAEAKYLTICSPCNSSYRKCGKELLWPQRPRQDDGGRYWGKLLYRRLFSCIN
jgi:hypothetical protein